MTDTDVQVQKLFNAGSHLGHKTERVHPKARKFIYRVENGVSIIDLTKTVAQLNEAAKFVYNLGKNNKTLLVVVTKKIAAATVQDLCQKSDIPYITVKWPAGLLSNFDMIMKNVKKLKEMKEAREKGEWEKFVKHEQVKLNKILNRLEKFYGGLVNLEKLPDALFVVDIRKEKNAVKEAKEKSIPTVAIVDTNADPETVNYPIVANDDSLSSIEFLTKHIIESYMRGKKK